MEYRKQQFETYEEFTRQFACDYSMPLARGGHGEIYRGIDLETNEEVAIKRRLFSHEHDALTLEKEYAHTQAMPPSRLIVRYLYYGRYATPFGTFEFLVMKYYRDGNLTSHALPWNALSEAQQVRFTREFLQGLAHLHANGVIHRDIKPENVLLVKYMDGQGTAYRPVLADFGISKVMADNPEAARAFVQNSMRVGTVTYMAPEQLKTENIAYNADLWSFGIILYEVITGKHMIARKSFPELQREEAYGFWRNIDEDRFPDDLTDVPQPYEQIIRKCLIVDSANRTQRAEELLELLDWQPNIAAAFRSYEQGNWEVAIAQLEEIDAHVSISAVSNRLHQARMNRAWEPDRPLVPVEEMATTLAGAATAKANPVDPATTLPAAPPAATTSAPADATPEAVTAAEPMPALDAIPETPAVTDATAAPVTNPAERAYESQLTDQFTQELPSAPNWRSVPNRPAVVAATTLPEPTPADRSPADRSSTERSPAEPVPVETLEAAPARVAPTKPKKTPRPKPVSAPARPLRERLPKVTFSLPSVKLPSAPAWLVRPTLKRPRLAFPPVQWPADWNVAALRKALPLRRPASAVPAVAADVVAPIPTHRPSSFRRKPLLAVMILAVLGIGLYSSTTSDVADEVADPATTLAAGNPANTGYVTELDRFRQYKQTYQDKGELNPYLWAFIRCNPTYEDTLVRAAVLRADNVMAYQKQVFPGYAGNANGLKKVEMKRLLASKMSWEGRSHELDEYLCQPHQ